MEESICELVRRRETDYIAGTTTLSKYVQHSMFETIEKVTAYLNSKHISGSKDSLGRDKPFFNVVTAAVNIWYRATDIDRKDIRIKPAKIHDELKAFIATVFLRQWMREANFGVFLNLWGRTLAQYGSAVVKFVEKQGVLNAQVIPWNRLIVDAVDFDANPKIEKLYLTAAQLRENENYDQEIVENLIAAGGTTRETMDGQQKDNLSGYFEIYEVHGELPLYYLTKKDGDKKVYRQQMHVVTFTETKAGEYQDFELYKGREAKDPYMITHLIPEDGRTLSIGAVEHLFEAQWMQNHSIKIQKDTLDLASKIVYQTSDGTFIGRNVLNAIETGDILIHKLNEPLTQVNDNAADLTAVQNFAAQWRIMSQELTSTPDAQRGITPPSGTPLGTTQILNQNSASLFEQMTENKGLAIEQMLRERVIPNLKKKLNNGDEIAATLEAHEITKIDALYIPREAVKRFNKRVLKDVLDNKLPNQIAPFDQQLGEQQVKQDLAPFGATRYFSPDDIKKLTWSEYFKDFEWDCEVEVTNEASDKATTLSTIVEMLKTSVNNPELYKLLMTKAMQETGVVSPIEVKTATAVPQPVQPQSLGG